jgi:formate/nitrite transporter FocA (FNT family)
MSGRAPTEIWEDALDEGERRLERGSVALAATGLLGGVDVMFGVIALVVSAAALSAVMPEQTAHLFGSLTFGLGLVFITIGRAELFTENFLLPVASVYTGRSSLRALARLWAITLAGNLAGLLLMALIFAPHGVLPPDGLKAAGKISDTYTTRAVVPALLSAVAGGALMTLLTWLAAAAENEVTRLFLSLLAGFVLVAPSLNHAVVGFGEIVFGMVAGTATGTVGDLARTFGLAVVGNLIGGIALVTTTRLVQVRGEPGSTSGRSERGRKGS